MTPSVKLLAERPTGDLIHESLGDRAQRLAQPGSGAHLVQFYEDEDFLGETVVEFIGAGLLRGERGIIVATEPHCRAVREAMIKASFDLERACQSGQLTILDASETTERICVDGEPSWQLFQEYIGGLLRRVGANGRVRVYGEMVDVLLRTGRPRAALLVEEMWNELGVAHKFALLCAYVMGNFYKEEHKETFERVCDAHGHVFPTEKYEELETDAARQREIGSLQQRARALESEIAYRRQVEDELRAKKEELEATVTRLNAVLGELEAANRTKDDFLATVSHELRTPLNAILGWVRMLRSETFPDEKRERALETIERNANAQTQLIEDLLDVSRIISGKLRLEVTGVDLACVVDNAIEAVRPAANARGVLLRQSMDADASTAVGDPNRLQQVVWNLVNNAVKFTRPGGNVDIVLRRRDSFLEIVVADDGQGIAPEFLPHIFERFRQADATTSRKHGGLGLGLAIVRHLVELHGGTVKVESEGLGKGSRFTVCLPMRAPRSTFERPPAVQLTSLSELRPSKELAGLRLLVVDDEPDARELLAELLRGCNAMVTTADSAEAAIAAVEEQRPDIIVSDVGMPGEDGYALIKRLRALPPERGGRTPAVALTVYARFEDRTKALVAGFNMHIPKPVEPAELLVVLSSLAALFPRS